MKLRRLSHFRRVSFRETLLSIFIFILINYPAWIRGEQRTDFQAPVLWFSLIVFLLLLLAPFTRILSKKEVLRHLYRRFLRILFDPILYMGILFFLLLYVQYWNARWSFLSEKQIPYWLYSAPKLVWLPSAVTRVEAKEMFYWFFPAFIAMLCIRHGIFHRSTFRLLLGMICVNAALLSIFGIIQFSSGTKLLYWVIPMKTYFFSTFGYTNHAGAFFNLGFLVSAGLLSYYLFRRSESENRNQIMLYCVCLSLAFIGANFSLSVFGILLSWCCAGVFLFYLFKKAKNKLTPAFRLYLIAAVLAAGFICFLSVKGFLGNNIKDEMTGSSKQGRLIGSAENRLIHVNCAVKIWLDYPWFGVGGWGYRYYIGRYIEKKHWRMLQYGSGGANVHNDFIQFMVEFGIVGAFLMLMLVGFLIKPLFLFKYWKREVLIFPLVGVFTVLVHSLIDLPFRNSVIIGNWLTVLTCCSQYALSLHMVSYKKSLLIEEE